MAETVINIPSGTSDYTALMLFEHIVRGSTDKSGKLTKDEMLALYAECAHAVMHPRSYAQLPNVK